MTATGYAYDLVERVDEVEAETWQAVCRDAGDHPYLGLGFLRAVELSFSHEARFWYAIFRDDAGKPVACTCFSLYLVDCALLAPRAVRRITDGVRKVWSSFLKHKILLCGVPVSTCNNQLAISEGADIERLALSLDVLALKLARDSQCKLISFKEFPPHMSQRMDALQGRGFLRARSLVAYSLSGDFGSFASYQASRSKRRRAHIRRSIQKFESAGLTCEFLRGRDGVDRLYTDEVHRLYLNVLDRAKVKFEQIPADFFRELARQVPDESCFAILRKGDRIVAFCCGLAAAGEHYMLYCGLDYALNADTDLYFNTIYRGLGQGLAPGVKVVHIGASADEFKRRMGCTGESLAIYVKAVGALPQFLLRQFFGLLFDTSPEASQANPNAAPQSADDEPKPQIDRVRAA
jgi:predicted N-acyltransferase